MIEYLDPDFRSWVNSISFEEGMGIPNRTLEETVRQRSNNFGAWGMASLLAAARYLVRQDIIDHPDPSVIDIRSIYSRHIGDQSAPIGSLGFSSDWQPADNESDNVSIIPRDSDNDSVPSANSDWVAGEIIGCTGFRGYGLMPEERRRDIHPVFGANTVYCSPWSTDPARNARYDIGYWSGITWTAFILDAQTNGSTSGSFNPWTHTTALEDAAGRLTEALWVSPDFGDNYFHYADDDRVTACMVASQGWPVTDACCLNPTNNHAVSKGSGFISFILSSFNLSGTVSTCTP